eukprot:TRINITY_DN13415_c0_g1_i2.p1 TRINITY_DN13415_c0_g1~~TRINITY_DN13415_c0_g1_i2.p1  ORF type:complete len:170 (+),score=48.55 TRINITY_DN13415_c0_g1_i2:114-623(+)
MQSVFFFFLMIRRPPRSTQGVSSAASDVYKRQGINAEYMGNHNQGIKVYPPSERVFDASIPEEDRWLNYEFYWKSAVQKLFFKKVTDEKLAKEISIIAEKAYMALKGCCYGRVDIRQDNATGKLYVLELNSVPNLGFESSSHYLLDEAGYHTEDLIEEIFYYGKRHYQK